MNCTFQSLGFSRHCLHFLPSEALAGILIYPEDRVEYRTVRYGDIFWVRIGILFGLPIVISWCSSSCINSIGQILFWPVKWSLLTASATPTYPPFPFPWQCPESEIWVIPYKYCALKLITNTILIDKHCITPIYTLSLRSRRLRGARPLSSTRVQNGASLSPPEREALIVALAPFLDNKQPTAEICDFFIQVQWKMCFRVWLHAASVVRVANE